ncbi:MAG TPA: zinc ABC transporter substrate-binding protein [Candidatus Nitrosotenuis sp.]|nr:zinc ABC transporter substrate-binding protein [Candidatus Nitrosotenuis sp.]
MRKPILAGIVAGVVGIAVALAVAQSGTMQDKPQTPAQAHPKIKVIASFYPLYEFSKNVGGQTADVSTFTPTGVEPHDWEPSTGDLLELKEADVFVYNGAGMEPFVEKLQDSGEYQNVLFVETASQIELIKAEDDEHSEEHDHDFLYDPHIWLDPILAKHQVETIKNAMIQVDPVNAQHYEDNAAKYLAELDALDSKIRVELSKCKKDTIVTFHTAFTYFANRYGIKTFALSGITPESEATATDLKNTVDFIKENDINVIFAEELIDPKLATALADDAGIQVLILSPLEGLSKEELAKGTTYLDKMEENLQKIKIALECQ